VLSAFHCFSLGLLRLSFFSAGSIVSSFVPFPFDSFVLKDGLVTLFPTKDFNTWRWLPEDLG
jgi:hypothetical protein